VAVAGQQFPRPGAAELQTKAIPVALRLYRLAVAVAALTQPGQMRPQVLVVLVVRVSVVQ